MWGLGLGLLRFSGWGVEGSVVDDLFGVLGFKGAGVSIMLGFRDPRPICCLNFSGLKKLGM